ncbi:MAG: Rid family hydrolase [Planctomycetota bacterium]|nr:Rid family hydrolase [Planctomycetota bacterium]
MACQPRLLPSLCLTLLLAAAPATASKTIRRIDPQPQQGHSAAVVVRGQSILHTGQLFPDRPGGKIPAGDLPAQYQNLMANLEQILSQSQSQRNDILKLNFYVSKAHVADYLRDALSVWFTAQTLPAVSYVQSRLPLPGTLLALDAVIAVPPIAGRRPRLGPSPDSGRAIGGATYSVMPRGDVIYISGQAQPGDLLPATTATLQGLRKTMQHLDLGLESIVQLKCFLEPITRAAEVEERITQFFGELPRPPVSHVEWTAGSLPIEIELIVHAEPAKSTESIESMTPPGLSPSPVFSRVVRLHGDHRIYLSGLYSRNAGDGASQVKDLFASMRTTLAAAGSDFRHLAKATYYVSDADSSTQLNQIRPTLYDAERPPAASKARVKGVGQASRAITIDMIAAPNPTVMVSQLAVATRIVKDTSTGDFKRFRRMITGPGVNEHPPYQGCTGFVGWEGVTRLRNGALWCTFSAGYWHVSFPTPIDLTPELLKSYQGGGFPADIDAPTGGRALVSRSTDNGQTWSQPITLVDTPGDDRHPCVVEHPDGTLVCVFFVIDNWYGYERPPAGRNKNSRVASIRSTDGGKTWSQPIFMPSPFTYYDRMCGKPVILPDGDILLSTYGKEHWQGAEQLGLYRSSDSGRSWKFVNRLEGSVGALDEPAVTRATDGTIIMIARPHGEIAFSPDAGQHWTSPRPFGIQMVAPCLMTLRDGTIVCIFGWGGTGGLQIMWSDDQGKTWTVPAGDRGFTLDNSVYVYGIGQEMPDNSIYVVYYDPAGRQRKTAIWGLRLKINEDRRGIHFLPID